VTEPRWERLRTALRRTGIKAQELNAQPKAVDALRKVRRVLPGDPGFGDPLSAAGTDSAAVVARLADRLFDTESKVSKELALGGLQVWHAALQRVGRGDVGAVTLLFTDLVGFSDWALRAGDEAALQLLRAVAKAQEPPVLAGRGQVVKRLGDGLMAVFPSPQLAFDAVTDIRARLAEVEVAGHRPQLRAGIHCGRPQLIGGDYLGVDVNVTARLVQRAGADETLLSAAAAGQLDQDRVDLKRKRTFSMARSKGVPQDLVVFAGTPR
jgi:adenylate cyclase